MEQRTNSPYPRIDRPTLAIIGVLLVLSCALFFASDRDHDWRYYQSAFKDEVAQKFGEERAAAVTTGLQQIWVADLGRADRCITCHQAVSWKGFETAEEPFRTHPLEPLKGHPIEKFGCTACHGGQGWAVDVLEAHGEIAHWEEPLLSRALGEDYSLSGNKGALIQMNCNSCHRYDRETKGADAINMAKRLVDEKGCRACHVINNRGGRIGPDLTRVGEKAPEQYDYSRLSGQKTAFAWHVAHLKDPKAVSADSSMPNFGFNTAQAQALAMLVLSWKPSHIPAAYLAGAPRTDVPTPEQAAEEERMRTGPGAWFVETGCATCHSIQDVQSRFGRTIDDFLREPTGTMSVVLSRQIILTPEQKAIAVQKLREAFAVYQKQQAEKER